ncbi:MAG: hypothetical protein Q4G45_13330, partial [Actinomycetia bacterium]|nr:hypothetical protein [Actinomycetes bacterium]
QSPSTYVGPSGSNPPTPPLRPYGADTATGYAAPPKPRQLRLSITVSLVALTVILTGIVVTMLVRWPTTTSVSQNSPSPTSTVRRPTAAPSTVSAGFSASPPDGWSFVSDPSSVLRAVHSETKSKIIVYSWVSSNPPVSFCDKQARSAAVWSEGTVSPLPAASFPSGEDFPGFRMEGANRVQMMRCVAHGERVFIVIAESQPADAETAAQGFDQLVAGWVWA